jgi:hypothetical protein
MGCINLKKRFGMKYRITFDPAYDPANRPREKLDPWYMQIPCRVGTIYPHGGAKLAVEVDGHKRVKAKLRRLGCCQLHQDGHNFGAFIFDAKDFDTVAKILRPHRKRQLSDEQREGLRDRMRIMNAQTPIKPGVDAATTHSETAT